MMGYKIETFSNPTIFPQTPNNETCYNYIKNVKKWNVGELTDKQLKVLFTMRALLGSQYSDSSKVFPFKDGCVIPSEHLPIFDISEETKSLTVSPPNKSDITIYSTDKTMYPQGLYVDFTDPNINYEKFKDILNGGYLLYDSEFLREKKRLENEILNLTKVRDSWEKVLANLENQTKNVTGMTAALNDPNSECQREKAKNATLKNKWDELMNSENYYSNRYHTLLQYVNDGIVKRDWLMKVYFDSFKGKYWFNDGGNVKSINNKNPPAPTVTAPRADSRCGPQFNNARCGVKYCCSTSGWCGGPGSDHCTAAKRSDTMYDG